MGRMCSAPHLAATVLCPFLSVVRSVVLEILRTSTYPRGGGRLVCAGFVRTVSAVVWVYQTIRAALRTVLYRGGGAASSVGDIISECFLTILHF
jgi:hypothetical protein